MASETTPRVRLPHGRAADLTLACCVFLLLAVWSAECGAAAMQLLGRRVWWLPARLARWLPKVALERRTYSS